jgi:hypothetical protein
LRKVWNLCFISLYAISRFVDLVTLFELRALERGAAKDSLCAGKCYVFYKLQGKMEPSAGFWLLNIKLPNLTNKTSLFASSAFFWSNVSFPSFLTFLFRCFRLYRQPHQAQGQSHQQNRPLPSRAITPIRLPPHPRFPKVSLAISNRTQSLFPATTMSSIHDHLQTARDRGCCAFSPRLHVSIHKPAKRGGILVRPRGRNERKRVSEFPQG